MRGKFLAIALMIGMGLAVSWPAAAAGLDSRVNEAFRGAFGRNPTAAENQYWLGRVVRKEKTSFGSLLGAMFYQKAQGRTIGETTSSRASSGSPDSVSGSSDKNTMIVQVLPLFVQIYGRDPSNTEKAWWRKRISCNEIKSLENLKNSMRYHKAKGVGKGRDTICGQKGTQVAAGVTAKRVAGFSDHPLGDVIRVGIYNAAKNEVVVTANGNYQVRAGSEVKTTLKVGQTVKVTHSGGNYHVRGAVNVDDPAPIRLVPIGGTIMQVKSHDDPSVSYPGKNYNRFRGIIEVRKCNGCGDVWVINELRAEQYVKGLGETLAKDPAAKEYYKALAVAARSYGLYHKNVTGGRARARGYDVGATADDQIYRGYEFELIVPRFIAAVDATRGTIVTDGSGNDPLITTYFSDTDGRTRTAKEVWNTTAPRFKHLQKSVADPHHQASSCRGHCVGLSAQGAFGFAKADGYSFQKILKYYYQGISLVKAY